MRGTWEELAGCLLLLLLSQLLVLAFLHEGISTLATSHENPQDSSSLKPTFLWLSLTSCIRIARMGLGMSLSPAPWMIGA